MKQLKIQFPIISVFFALAVILSPNEVDSAVIKKRALAPLNKNPGSFKVVGDSGIAAMHIVLTAPTKILIIDKVENNPIKQKDGRVAVSVEYDIPTNKIRVLNLNTNTFCSAGSFLGNGTLVHTGGAETKVKEKFLEGFESIRLFDPCDNGKCDWFENKTGLTSKRWYPSMVTLSDGRVFILGGSLKPLSVNSAANNNPTFEFFPKESSKPEKFPFLVETLPFNLYPAVHVLPGPANQKRLFVFSNTDSIVWDWGTKSIVKRLDRLPGPPRSYPLTGTSVMLPLRPEENYAPQILVCGGVAKNDVKQPADNSCGRINLSNINNAKWEREEFGGIGRNMPDVVILADGKTLFLNGAGIGVAGYNNNEKQKADNPTLTPVLYDHRAPIGKRFTRLTSSKIPRLYHSVATLVPDGRVFVTGSNPNAVVRTKDTKYITDFRVEMFTPPYFQKNIKRATITSVAGKTLLNKGAIRVKYNKVVPVTVTIDDPNAVFSAALVHYGFVTHSVHMSQRYVVCTVKNVVKKSNGVVTMDVIMPPNGNMIAPGRNYLYINNKGVPGITAIEVMISN
ncbi:12086_t:CDS:2 [Funneliformis geosporum]|uniref:6502_t:CDS:1 n=1 Tax=Funneliformis geosporum TaxID=1117311 RepID=A0A9W4WS55_9GLOM|nr:6502_t:CDS:2 [Funneliformis geosporum]CAI2186057.1 12086_t:CDS:2 [Funneliformis geosporum]